MPELRVTTISFVRPLPWARALPGLRFTPERWGTAIALKAPGGTHLLLRQHSTFKLAVWLPERLAPRSGEPFGLYLHPDAHVAERLEAVDPVLECGVFDIGDARLDRVVEPLQAQLRFRRALVQLGDMLAAARALFLPPVENMGENGFQPRGLEQAFL